MHDMALCRRSGVAAGNPYNGEHAGPIWGKESTQGIGG